MLRINKNDYDHENCATMEFNNALDNFATKLWHKSRSMNLKDVVCFVYDHANKICVEDSFNVTYSDLKRVARRLVDELNLDRSQTTELMIIDEIYTISGFYSRCDTESEDF